MHVSVHVWGDLERVPAFFRRLCEDFIGKRAALFGEQLDWLPARMRGKIAKRAAALVAAAPGPTA